MFQNPPIETIRQTLSQARCIAVLGLSPKPERDSYRVAKHMQDFGCRIIPVRPAQHRLLDEQAWPSLSALPGELLASIDIIDVFRNAEHVAEVVDECLSLGLTGKTLWLQLGVVDEAAAARAVAGGMRVIMDRCIYVDYLRLVAA